MDAIRELSTALAGEPDIQLAVVFGSAVLGKLRPDSDIDVGIQGATSSERLSALSVLLSRVSGRQVDLIALEQAPPLLRFEVARTGTLLFERRPSAWSDFKARALVDWWDWAPYARRFASAAASRLRREHDTHGAP